MIPVRSSEKPYYPPPESKGTWRHLESADDVLNYASMDAAKLERVFELQDFLFGGTSSATVIIRRGYLVREHSSFMGLASSRFDIWSCTKSFTGLAWGLLLEDSRQGRLDKGQKVELDSPAYAFLEGYPLSDSRKESITIRHLLSMTSGIAGESLGVYGVPTATGQGPFEHALGRCPNRYGKWVDKLAAEPGTQWDYSDPAMAHLALLFANITGQEIHDYMKKRVFDPIGVENASWDVLGGNGLLGPHTCAHVGLHISARELARVGYLMCHKGKWQTEQIIPEGWLALATQSSQDLNPDYGHTFWVNTQGTHWPNLPKDMFAFEGHNSNRCYVIPSLDLVVTRIGSGPVRWNEQDFISGIVDAIL